MTYKQAVTEARGLVKRSEADQWRLAQLTWEQVEAGKTRQQWAADIGVNPSHAQRLYLIGAKYHDISAPKRPRFADAYSTAMGRSEAIAEHGSHYAAEARTAFRNLPVAEKAKEIAQAVREEPALIAHPKLEKAVSRAQDENLMAKVRRNASVPTVSREDYAKGMKQARESDALLALLRAQEALGRAQLFTAHQVVEKCDEKYLRGLLGSLPRDIRFLEDVLEAVQSTQKLRVVGGRG